MFKEGGAGDALVRGLYFRSCCKFAGAGTVLPIKFLISVSTCRPDPFNFAVVDEVDSVLIDEGRNPLLVSSQASSVQL